MKPKRKTAADYRAEGRQEAIDAAAAGVDRLADLLVEHVGRALELRLRYAPPEANRLLMEDAYGTEPPRPRVRAGLPGEEERESGWFRAHEKAFLRLNGALELIREKLMGTTTRLQGEFEPGFTDRAVPTAYEGATEDCDRRMAEAEALAQDIELLAIRLDGL